MARLNDEAQWIILMGFLVSFSLFFLAVVINQSTVVGQTTAEGVIEFPKNDIRDTSTTITKYAGKPNEDIVNLDITLISLDRKDTVVNYVTTTQYEHLFTDIHYNNGVCIFDENWTSL